MLLLRLFLYINYVDIFKVKEKKTNNFCLFVCEGIYMYSFFVNSNTYVYLNNTFTEGIITVYKFFVYVS